MEQHRNSRQWSQHQYIHGATHNRIEPRTDAYIHVNVRTDGLDPCDRSQIVNRLFCFQKQQVFVTDKCELQTREVSVDEQIQEVRATHLHYKCLTLSSLDF